MDPLRSMGGDGGGGGATAAVDGVGVAQKQQRRRVREDDDESIVRFESRSVIKRRRRCGNDDSSDDELAEAEEDREKNRSQAVRKLADLLLRFLKDPDNSNKVKVLEFFQDERNVQDFPKPGDVLWRGGEYCAFFRSYDPTPYKYGQHDRDRREWGRSSRSFRHHHSSRSRPPTQIRPVASFIECLLESSNWNLPVQDLLTELVQKCPQVLHHTTTSPPPPPPPQGRVRLGAAKREPLYGDSDNDETTIDAMAPTFLHVAVQRAGTTNFDVIRLFARPEHAVVADSTSLGWTPLHWSASFLPANVTWFLLQLNPAAASIADADGLLPIHHYLSVVDDEDFSWPVLDRFVNAHPESLSCSHPETGLEPIVAVLKRSEFRWPTHLRGDGGGISVVPDRFASASADVAANSASRILRQHRPPVLQNPVRPVPGLNLVRPPRSRFDTPLMYWCQKGLHVDLLDPLIDLCPIALVASHQVWRKAVHVRREEEAADDRNEGIDVGDGENDNIIIVPEQPDAAAARVIFIDDDNDRADAEDNVVNDDDVGYWVDKGTPLEWVQKNPNRRAAPDRVDRCLTIATNEMFLALVEALLSSALRREVLDRIAAHVPNFDVAHHPLSSLIETGGVGGIGSGSTILRLTRAGTAVASATATDALRTDVIHLSAVQELLFESSTFRDCATGLYRVNRHVDAQRFFASGPVAAARRSRQIWTMDLQQKRAAATASNPADLFGALQALQECSNGNLDCVYVKLRSRPGVLRDVTRGAVAVAGRI